MVLAYLAASLAKQGGRPPSPRTAMAMMAALLAAQITWTVTKHQSARLGDPASIAPSSASVVDDEGFSLALGVRRADAGGGGGRGGGAGEETGDAREDVRRWIRELVARRAGRAPGKDATRRAAVTTRVSRLDAT
jgi:hypothetical protein